MDFGTFLQQRPPEPPRAPDGTGDFGAFLEQAKGALENATTQQAQTTAVVNAQQPTQQAAAAAKLAPKVGLPAEAVETDLPRFEAQAKAERNAAILAANPLLARWVAANPHSARVAQDEFEQLDGMSKVLAIGKDAAVSSLAMLGQSFAESAKAVNRQLGLIPRAYGAVTGDDRAYEWWRENMTGGAMAASRDLQSMQGTGLTGKISGAVGGLLGMLSQMTLTGGGGGGQLPASAGVMTTIADAVKTASRSMAFPSLVSAVNTGSDVYDKTGDVVQANAAAVGAYLNTVAMGVIPLSAPGGLARRMVSGGIAGGVQSEVQRTTMNLLLPPEMQRQWDPEEALFQAMTGAAMAGIMGPRAYQDADIYRAARQTYVEAERAEKAERDVQRLAALGEMAAASTLREADPVAFREAIRTIAEDSDVPAVWVNGRLLGETLAQSKIEMPGLRAEIGEAIATGGDVRIPIEDWATSIAGKPVEQALLPEIKTAADGMTVREGQVYFQELATNLQARAEQLAEVRKQTTEEQKQVKAVHDEVLTQLDATQRLPHAVNKAYASLISETYANLAQRAGMTAEQLWKAAPLRVVDAGMPGSYQQSPGALPMWALERATGARVTEASKKSAIALAPKASLARRNYEKLDAIFTKTPNPLASEDSWRKFMSTLVADRDVLGVPYVALKYAQDPQAVADYLKRLRPDQLASRRAGFELGAQIRSQYAAGNATPVTTGRLLLWAMLSRKAGAYPHEAAYMDLVNGGVDRWIEKAASGDWTEADSAAYVKWSSEYMATKKDGTSPGAGVTSNANDFGRVLLTKLAQKDSDGKTGLERLHEMIADHSTSTDKVRREFFALGDSVGIQNKVLSFALLVTGRWDTLVLDRVQFTHLWGDKYRERAGQRNIYDGSAGGLAAAGEGHFGLAVYEAMARGMSDSVRKGYELAGMTGPGDGTLGAFHWDSWLIESSQAIGHPTVEALATDRPRADLAVRQGKFDTYSYNFEYRADGQYQIPLLDGGGYRILSPADAADFAERIKDPKNGVVPRDFKVSQHKSSPWVDAEGVNRGRYNEILNEYGRPAAAEDVAPAGAADAGGQLQGGAADAGRGQAALAADQVAPARDGLLLQGERGAYDPLTRTIGLLKTADLSTFLHESGHHFLEVFHGLALQDGAPAQIKADFDILLRDFGVEGDTPEARMAAWSSRDINGRRAGHERFAEQFERYLLEGKAPSQELQSIFSRFRSWLINIYKQFTGAELTPEVRGVMDRLIASDEAIRDAEEARGYVGLPREAFPDDAAFAAYRAAGQAATDESIAEMQARSLREMKWTSNAKSRALRALQAEADAERKAIQAQVEAEVDADPAFAAAAYLRETMPEYAQAMDVWRAEQARIREQARQQVDAAQEAATQANRAWDEENPPPRKPKPGETTVDVVEYRKRASVLKSVLECLT